MAHGRTRFGLLQSFFLVLMKGDAYCGLINRTAMPSDWKRRTQGAAGFYDDHSRQSPGASQRDLRSAQTIRLRSPPRGWNTCLARHRNAKDVDFHDARRVSGWADSILRREAPGPSQVKSGRLTLKVHTNQGVQERLPHKVRVAQSIAAGCSPAELAPDSARTVRLPDIMLFQKTIARD